MTGNEMIAEFDGIAANDLDPLATTTAAKLILLNIAAKRVMWGLKLLIRSVPMTYVTATTRYDLLTAPTTPLLEVNRVRKDDVDYYIDPSEDGKGWSQMDEKIDFFFDATNGDTIYLDGYQAPEPITASATSITDIPVDIQLCVVQLAIVEGCVAHEDDPSQLLRLQRLQSSAMDKIARRRGKNASTAFPFKNSRT